MKECPFCVTPIDDDAIRCRHCGKVLGDPFAGPSSAARPDDDVREQLRSGNKIAAIKLVRERTNLGLKEAKDYVEAIERGETPPPPPAATPGSTHGGCGKAVLLVAGVVTIIVLVLHAL